jgi:hypothetical protein
VSAATRPIISAARTAPTARPIISAARTAPAASATSSPSLVPHEYELLGALLVGLAVFGAGFRAHVLLFAVPAVVLALAASMLRRTPFRLLLIDVWSAAFAYLYLSDLVLTQEAVQTMFASEVTVDAEAFLVASFGMSLLGAAWFDRRARRRRVPVAGMPLYGLRRRPSFALSTLLLGLSALIVAYVLWGIGPSQLFATARVDRSFEDTASRPLLIAALVVQPILAAYVTRRYRQHGPVLWIAWLVGPLSALALYASGTRFYLGFMLCGVLHYALRPLEPMSRRRRMAIAAAAIAFLALQGTMRASRTTGLVDLDASELAGTLSNAETFLSSEGLLRVNAWVQEKQAWTDPNRPFENAFILYWWVPRSWWPDKPAMEGRRLIEDVMDEGWFSANHSVAGGFAMPALLDFGPWLGALCAGLYGVGLGALQRFAWRHRSLADPASLIVSLAAFGVFFTARGLHVSLIFVSLCLLWMLPVLWIERRRPGAPPVRAVPRRTARPSVAGARFAVPRRVYA